MPAFLKGLLQPLLSGHDCMNGLDGCTATTPNHGLEKDLCVMSCLKAAFFSTTHGHAQQRVSICKQDLPCGYHDLPAYDQCRHASVITLTLHRVYTFYKISRAFFRIY